MRLRHTLSRGATLVCALGLSPTPVALAASGGSPTQSGGEQTPLSLSASTAHHASSGGSGIVRTIVALAIVIAVIYAIARILKAVKGRDQRASGDGLKHLSTLPLGNNKSVALVRSGLDIVLVGISDAGVTPIKTYTEDEAIANGMIAAPAALGEPDPAESSFQWLDHLRRLTVRS